MNNGEEIAFGVAVSVKTGESMVPVKVSREGLTKREYLAGLAMQGLIASELTIAAEDTAECAVFYANALLEELEK